MKARNPVAATHKGSGHWRWQRLSALALLPLGLWFLFAVVQHIGDDYHTLTAWVAQPGVAVGLILSIGLMFFHADLGIQVVLDDYVHHDTTKMALCMMIRLVFIVAIVGSVWAILRLAF